MGCVVAGVCDCEPLQETISTCRFAQRVAMIKNDAILNEELDPKLMIERLRREVQQLKDELSMATGEQRTDSLTDDDIARCCVLAILPYLAFYLSGKPGEEICFWLLHFRKQILLLSIKPRWQPRAYFFSHDVVLFLVDLHSPSHLTTNST